VWIKQIIDYLINWYRKLTDPNYKRDSEKLDKDAAKEDEIEKRDAPHIAEVDQKIETAKQEAGEIRETLMAGLKKVDAIDEQIKEIDASGEEKKAVIAKRSDHDAIRGDL
jgi:hypothetical protein